MDGPNSRNRFKTKCPRKLDQPPGTWCHLGALRMKALRSLVNEPSQEEEAGLPGCPYAISHQFSNYCWFKYESEHMKDESCSDQEAAALLGLSTETVKKTADMALDKLRKSNYVADLKKHHGKDPIVDDSSLEDIYIYTDSGV